jgi:hypothetical protein
MDKDDSKYIFSTMDLDSDPRFVEHRRTRYAKNIIKYNQGKGKNFSVKPLLGNELCFTIAAPQAQNAKFNISVKETSTPPKAYLTILDSFGNPIFPNTAGTPIDLADVIADLNTQLTNAGFSDQCVALPNGSYDLELTLINGYSYDVYNYTKSYNPLQVTQVHMPIDPALVDVTPIVTSSYDMNGATFILSTLDNDQRGTYDIVGLAANGSVIEVTTSQPHNITAVNEWVEIISDTSIYPFGKWSAIATGANSFTLSGSDSGLLPITLINGKVITKASTWLQLGVLDQTCGDNCGYIRLLGTTQIAASPYYQQDMVAEPQSSCEDAVYWVDNKDTPRCIYVPKPYITDGCLDANGGKYNMANVDKKSQLWIYNPAKTSLYAQYSTGGNLKGAAWQYCATLLIDEATETEPTLLTNQVYVTPAKENHPQGAYGISNILDEPTTKVNEILVTDIPMGVFKYVVLYGVRFFNNSIIEAVRIKQQLLGTNHSIVIQHTGNESTTSDTDAALLQYVGNVYNSAKNIDIVKNKLVLSNLNKVAYSDIGAWAKTFEHAVIYQEFPLVAAGAEYTDAINPNEYMGYMANETYRFGLIGRNKATQTYIPLAFWVDDIIIDTNTVTNSANPTDNRRVAAVTGTPFVDYSLTDNTGSGVMRVPHIEFSNIDWTFPINGKQIKDIIDEIQIVRVECIPEILASGLGVACPSGIYSAHPAYFVGVPLTYDIPFQGVAGDIGTGEQTTDEIYAGAGETHVAFYSPDIYLTGDRLSLTANTDKIRVLGTPPAVAGTHQMVKNAYTALSTYTEISADNLAATYTDYTIAKYGYCNSGEYITLTGDNFTNRVYAMGTYNKHLFECYFFKTATNIFVLNDYLYKYVQIYKQLTDKYGDKQFSRYINTNTYVQEGNAVVAVFGGDTYTYGTYLRMRFANEGDTSGFEGGIRYYMQSRHNAAMRALEKDSTGTYKQYYNANSDLVHWLEDVNGEHFSYNRGYSQTGRQAINVYATYNTTLNECPNQPAMFHWSEQKIQGGGNDAYRVFKPNNIKMGDLRAGAIVHHGTFNGELVSWQKRGFRRYYFDANNILRANDVSEILLGSDTTMRGAGQLITALGCQHKWAVIKGLSAGGNDTYYWWNIEMNCINRIGADGTVRKSKIDGVETEIAEISNWLACWDTPAAGAGICGVYDKGRNLAIWTARGLNPVITKYDNTINYLAGDVVYYNGRVYKALANNVNIYPKGSPLWVYVPETDTRYFNTYTLVYDETDNGFICFNSPKPKIYIQAKDNYFTPQYDYIADTNLGCKIYRHNTGDYLSWYDGTLEEDGYIEVVLNEGRSVLKHYLSILVESNINPYKVDVETSTMKTTMLSNEWEQQLSQWRASVKNNSIITLNPKGDTSAIIDTFAIVRFYFKPKEFRELLSISAHIDTVKIN